MQIATVPPRAALAAGAAPPRKVAYRRRGRKWASGDDHAHGPVFLDTGGARMFRDSCYDHALPLARC